MTKVMFLDESGDHSLDKIDPQYPIFVLAGAIFDFNYYQKEVLDIIKKYKQNIFGNEDIILHTADICRNRKGFEQLKDKNFREKFYNTTNQLIDFLNFEIVAVAVHKKKHLLEYGLEAVDPYLLSLEFLVERFIFALDDYKEKGIIMAESRGRQLDNQLELAWLNLKIKGTKFIGPSRIIEEIQDFKIAMKSAGGLEIADLVVSPIGRFLLKKKVKDDFKIIKKKFRRDKNGKILGYGLVVFPIEKKSLL